MGITRWINRYQSRRDGQAELRMRLRDLAGSRVRYGYRRLTILLRREGWKVNAKRVYRLYREEGLQVQKVRRAKRAARVRVPLSGAVKPNQRWSMDFVSDRLMDGRWFRILTVVDQYTRECLCAYADRSQTGEKVVERMRHLVAARGVPESITTDNGLNASIFSVVRHNTRGASLSRGRAPERAITNTESTSGLHVKRTPLNIMHTRSALSGAVFTALEIA